MLEFLCCRFFFLVDDVCSQSAIGVCNNLAVSSAGLCLPLRIGAAAGGILPPIHYILLYLFLPYAPDITKFLATGGALINIIDGMAVFISAIPLVYTACGSGAQWQNADTQPRPYVPRKSLSASAF